jgi:DtxR family Mn-dependent transcriptional regulator
MAAVLGYPVRDPHGEPIPTADLKMPPDDSAPLSSLRPPQKATIRSIRAADSDLLRHLEGLGLVPGAEIEVTAYSPFDHNSTLKLAAGSTVLGPTVTSRILVERR